MVKSTMKNTGTKRLTSSPPWRAGQEMSMELHQAQEGRVSDRQLQMMWFTFVEKVQVFAKDASHDLSYEKLAYNLDKIHLSWLTFLIENL